MEQVTFAMFPHLPKEARTKILNSYKNKKDDQREKVPNAIIEKDRQRLRELLSLRHGR